MKASLPQGVRDFLPQQVIKRQYMFDQIKKIFELYGYTPIETPVMEKLNTLTGKYGEEGDRLIFKILNNGDFLDKVKPELLSQKNTTQLLPLISKRALRYDLTVPFARFVAQHLNELYVPFKRYQIQPVWRADRPQKGRFREFYQCDVDVVGSDSLLYEAELLQIYDQVFSALGIQVHIKINHRNILNGLIQKLQLDRNNTLITTLDKIDKIGKTATLEKLKNQGLNNKQLQIVTQYLNAKTIEDIQAVLHDTTAETGVRELQTILRFQESYTSKNKVTFDPSLARGLDYYTGFIVEVTDPKAEIGSLGGGGRYANLTELFGVKNMSGVGISFGAERIFELMTQRNLFPPKLGQIAKCIILYDIPEAQIPAFTLLNTLRAAGIPSIIYPDAAKLKKQFKYVEKLNVPFVIIIGQTELKEGRYTLKNLNDNSQEKYSPEELSTILS